MDGPIEHYHRQLASLQNYKDRSQLEGVHKYYDRCKEEKSHAYSIEERDLRRSFQQLQKEKELNKRRGSCLSDYEGGHDEKCNDRKQKGLVVKLQPGKIDTERMSPPSSHDVAVRMLFDKKGQCVKKKKKSKKRNEDLSVQEPLNQSRSHKEAVLKLPHIEKKQRRRSFADSEDFLRRQGGSYDRVEVSPKPMKSKHSTANKQIYDMCINPEIVVTSEQQHISQAKRSQERLRQSMKTPTPDVWQQSPPLTPQKAWGAQTSKGMSFEEIERVAECNKAKLPRLPSSKSNLVDSRNDLPAGYVQDERKFSTFLGQPYKDQKRRLSMDYKDMDFLDRRHSFVPADIHQRRTSVGSYDPSKHKIALQVEEETSNKKKNVHKMTEEMLEHYYSLLAENQKLLQENDSNFSLPPEEKKHIPTCTLKRSQRRKTLALELLLKQLPSYKHIVDMNPKEMLDCRYLRLSRNNIEELEDLCRAEAQDPGIHAHMTAQEVEDYFDQLDNASSEGSESISDIDLQTGTSTYNRPISSHLFN